MIDTRLHVTTATARRAFLVCHFLRWLPAGLVLPIMVLLLTQRGLGLTQVGYVFATYAAVTTVLELPTGGLADALGRKPVLLLATVFDAGLPAGLLLGHRTWHFLLGAAVGAVGRALLSGPLESWYVDTARAIEPGIVLRPALSAAGVVESAAIGLGALLSAVLPIAAGDLPLDGLVSLLSLPLLAALVVEGVSATAVAVLVREPPRPAQRVRVRDLVVRVPGVIRAGIRLAVTGRDVRVILGATFVLTLGAVTVETLWQPRFADLLGGAEIGVRANGFLVVGMSLATMAGAYLANHLPHAVARRGSRAAACSMAGAAVALAGLAAATAFVPALAAFLLLYVGLASAHVLRAELLHDRVPAARRATMLSMLSLSQQAGSLVSSLVLARVAQMAGIPVAWIIGALTLVAAGGLMLVIRDAPARDAAAGVQPAGA